MLEQNSVIPTDLNFPNEIESLMRKTKTSIKIKSSNLIFH